MSLLFPEFLKPTEGHHFRSTSLPASPHSIHKDMEFIISIMRFSASSYVIFLIFMLCHASVCTCLLGNWLCFYNLRVSCLLTQPTKDRKYLLGGWMNRKGVLDHKRCFLDQDKHLIFMWKAALAFKFSKHFIHPFRIFKDNY